MQHSKLAKQSPYIPNSKIQIQIAKTALNSRKNRLSICGICGLTNSAAWELIDKFTTPKSICDSHCQSGCDLFLPPAVAGHSDGGQEKAEAVHPGMLRGLRRQRQRGGGPFQFQHPADAAVERAIQARRLCDGFTHFF